MRVEQLHNDIDLNTKVTRAEFEEKCSDLFARVTAPIDAALAMAGLDLAKVDAVELLGGSVRMPKVKSLLDEYFGKAESKEDKIEVGQHLNGDEAMALGAAVRPACPSACARWACGTPPPSASTWSLRTSRLEKGGAFGGLFGGKKKTDDEEGDAWRKKTGLWALARSCRPTRPWRSLSTCLWRRRQPGDWRRGQGKRKRRRRKTRRRKARTRRRRTRTRRRRQVQMERRRRRKETRTRRRRRRRSRKKRRALPMPTKRRKRRRRRRRRKGEEEHPPQGEGQGQEGGEEEEEGHADPQGALITEDSLAPSPRALEAMIAAS